MAPLWFSSYVLQLRVPMVSLTVENIADFISAYIIGNLLQMAFRFWAFRRWVFPDEFARSADAALGPPSGTARWPRPWKTPRTLEGGPDTGVVTLFRRPAHRSAADRTGCRRLRDTAARGPVPRAGCRRTPAVPLTPTSMISVPVRSIRSTNPRTNSTLLIRASGTSMPLRVSTPVPEHHPPVGDDEMCGQPAQKRPDRQPADHHQPDRPDHPEDDVLGGRVPIPRVDETGGEGGAGGGQQQRQDGPEQAFDVRVPVQHHLFVVGQNILGITHGRP